MAQKRLSSLRGSIFLAAVAWIIAVSTASFAMANSNNDPQPADVERFFQKNISEICKSMCVFLSFSETNGLYGLVMPAPNSKGYNISPGGNEYVIEGTIKLRAVENILFGRPFYGWFDVRLPNTSGSGALLGYQSARAGETVSIPSLVTLKNTNSGWKVNGVKLNFGTPFGL